MLHAKFQIIGHSVLEKKIFHFLPYMGVAAILVMSFIQTFVPPSRGCSMLSLTMNVQAVQGSPTVTQHGVSIVLVFASS